MIHMQLEMNIMKSKIECLRIKGNARLELKQLILMGQLVGGEGQEVGGVYDKLKNVWG